MTENVCDCCRGKQRMVTDMWNKETMAKIAPPWLGMRPRRRFFEHGASGALCIETRCLTASRAWPDCQGGGSLKFQVAGGI
jgi:hypothetical protein